MAYTKNTWADGDIVTSEKLNHMEDGIANSESIMIINDTDGTLDKTWQEIHDAVTQGKMCVVIMVIETPEERRIVIETDTVTQVYNPEGNYLVTVGTGADSYSYAASSATGYPMLEGGVGG